ncbi:hypothetical protein M2417_002190 [Raoultella terrigena]|jgi:hypothetical protein|nr:hypothetical protein [Raoultella terrigena]
MSKKSVHQEALYRGVTVRISGKKMPIVGDGQRLHTAIRCFTQGISMLINQDVDL